MKTAVLITLISVVALAYAAKLPKDCSHVNFTPFSVHKEICGSDGKTYITLKHLEYENCINDSDVTVVREGWCDLEEEKRLKEEQRKFNAEYAKRIRQALKEGRKPDYIADLAIPNLDDYPEEAE